MKNYSKLFEKARLKKGLSIQEVVKRLGRPDDICYQALERSEEEFFTLNLQDIINICKILDLDVTEFFEIDLFNANHTKYTPEELKTYIDKFIKNKNISVNVLEERVGWEFYDIITDVNKIRQYPPQFFIDLGDNIAMKGQVILNTFL